MTRKWSTSWRTKLLALLLVFSVAPMLALAYWSIEGLTRKAREATFEGLVGLAKTKAEAIDQFTSYRKRDVERVATLMAPFLSRLERAEAREPQRPRKALPKLEDAESLKNAGVHGKPAAPQKLTPREGGSSKAAEEAHIAARRTLGLIMWDQKDFEELLLIDSTGRVVASTFAEHEGKSASDLDYFQKGRKMTYVQPVFLSPITGELTMVIAAPIRDENETQIGVVAARLNLDRFFRVIGDQTGLGVTGETVVAKELNGKLVFMAPTRHDAKAALNRKVGIGSRQSSGLQEAARGQTGVGYQIDYRGVPTFAAWQHVPSLDWGLVVKTDAKEAMAAVVAARDRTMALGITILALVALASIVAARALVRPLRSLKEATDRISRGDFAVELDIRSNDEIGELADSFERMVAAIKFFRENQRSSAEEEDLPAATPSEPPDVETPERSGGK